MYVPYQCLISTLSTVSLMDGNLKNLTPVVNEGALYISHSIYIYI